MKNKKHKRTNNKKFNFLIVIYIILISLFLGYSIFLIVGFFDNNIKENTYKKYHSQQENYYTELVQKEGIDAAFIDLKSNYKKNPRTRKICHDIVHFIGRAAVDKYPSVEDAFKYGDAFCWSGYYHGVMEKILSQKPLFNESEKINSICENIPGRERYSFDYYNCVHGLGHGFMYITDNELFESLETCDKFDGWWERESCYGGVFMENVNTNLRYHYTKYLKDDDPLYPCNVASIRYKPSCYLMQTSYILDINGADFSGVFNLCKEVEEPYTDICYQSLGRDASGYSVSDVKKTSRICLLGKDFRQRSNCVIGAVKDFISYFHSDVEAKKLCSSLPEELKEKCFQTAREFYKVF